MGKIVDIDSLTYHDIYNAKTGKYDIVISRKELEVSPTVDAEPVVHAEWQFDSGCGRVKHYRCTRCGRTVCTFGYKPLLEEFPYCNCGAKMTVEKPVESVDNFGGGNNGKTD